MKKFIVLIFSIVTLSALAQEKGEYTIKGKIDNYNAPALIYLQYMKNGEAASYSAPLKNGQFSFSGLVDEPVNGRLVLLPAGGSIDNNRRYTQTLSLMLAAETIEVNSPDVLQNAEISGSKTNAEYQELWLAIRQVNDKIDALMQEYENVPVELMQDESYIRTAQLRYENLKREEKDTYIHFITHHLDSYISLLAVAELLQQSESVLQMDRLLKGLTPEIQNTPTGQALMYRVNAARVTAIGSVAPDFTLNDPSGHAISLSDFRGKYLLLDFWASWCGPCRMENPNLVKNYGLYKDKNFEILGVSLDNPGSKAAWTRAIEKDKLSWPQVSELGGWQSSIALKYSVSAIPQNLLLDPDGVIIAKNLRGEALSETLAELFN